MIVTPIRRVFYLFVALVTALAVLAVANPAPARAATTAESNAVLY